MTPTPDLPTATVPATQDLNEAQAECPNCQAERAGDYCSACGHSFRIDRLTFKVLFAEFARKFLNFEQGLLATIKEMMVDPGGVARRYIQGQRKRYVNPLTYIVFGSALNVIVYRVSGMMERIVDAQLQTVAQDGQDPGTAMMLSTMMEFLVENTLYLTLFAVVPMAFMLRWLLGSNHTRAEMMVMPLYVFGHTALLNVPIVLMVAGLGASTDWLQYSVIGLYLVYFSWAGFGLFKSAAGAVLTVVSVVIGYACMTVVGGIIGIGIGVYSAINMRAEMDRAWTLFTATEAEAVAIVDRLLDDGADPNALSRTAPLHMAVLSRNEEIAYALLDHGADPNLRDDAGYTPTYLALRSEQPALTMRLLEAGTSVDFATDEGKTLLMEALLREDDAAARWLVEHGADVNAQREHRSFTTALMIAADDGNLPMVELLLAQGADPTVTNENGRTALDVADGDDVVAVLQAAMP
ncbi:MAG: ankyrin repeat domain-containing protein [Bacteroidota bacterium]